MTRSMPVFVVRVIYRIDKAGKTQVDVELLDKTGSGQYPDELTVLGALVKALSRVPELYVEEEEAL